MNVKHQLIAIPLIFIMGSCGSGNTSPAANNDSTTDTTTGTPAGIAIPINPLKECFFGDLHLHTAFSADANFFGATLLPEDAYKYARGEEVTYMGQKVKRIAPLDFLAVTDHSEYLGAIIAVRDPKGPFVGTELYKQYTSGDQKDVAKSFADFAMEMAANKPNPELNKPEVAKSAWQKVIDAANGANTPGKFTALVGYEWTSAPLSTEKAAQNLHRCVIFKGDKVPALPFSSFDSNDPEELWAYLENDATVKVLRSLFRA